MAAYTRRLGVVQPAAIETWTPVYTAGEGHTTIIRDLQLVNHSAATIPLVALRVIPGAGGTMRWFGYWTSLPIGLTRLDMRQELIAGERLEVFTQVATLTVWVTGYAFQA